MDLRKIESVIKESQGDIVEKKDKVISRLDQMDGHDGFDSSTALRMFLDHISISSIPGIKTSPVVEVNCDDCLSEAIKLMYERNVYGAMIANALVANERQLSERYVGFIDIGRMVLWSLEECVKVDFNPNEVEFKTDKVEDDTKSKVYDRPSTMGFFSLLEKIPRVGKTKVGELAKSFLWDPFFPVHPDDTLFHVLMLLAKHRLQVVPVTKPPNSHVSGFITQIAVVQLLLQSSGLEWFDDIAEKALSEFRFENNGCPALVYGDESIADAFHSMWENQVDAIPVINPETKCLIGNVRMNDIQLLLENDQLFHNRRSLTVENFMSTDARKMNQKLDPSALPTVGALCLNNECIPPMSSPVTNRKTDTLKQAMKVLVESQSNRSFLINESRHLVGEVTVKDVIMQFSPPCIDSRIDGGGFFQSALEQTGCHVDNGRVIRD